jgi:hypothetical protein
MESQSFLNKKRVQGAAYNLRFFCRQWVRRSHPFAKVERLRWSKNYSPMKAWPPSGAQILALPLAKSKVFS